MSIYGFTGNPFVDTGLCVAAHLLGKSNANDIGLDELKQALDEGHLAKRNSRLKSFTMIFGTNGPLMQSSYKKIDRQALYTTFLRNILQAQATSNCEPCELCGTLPAVDINTPFKRALEKYSLSLNGIKVIGRDLIPMAGSLGNCAQSLPGSTKPLTVCARCLVAVNFLPLGSQLINGRLATFECANQPLAYKIVGRNVKRNIDQLAASNGKVENLGGKQRQESVVQCLVDALDELKPDDKGDVTHPLYIWLYSNSGTGTDCSSLEIPSLAIKFLWDATYEHGYRKAISSILKTDHKLPSDQQLLHSIQHKQFYPGLMPRKGNDDIQLGFSQLYLNHICGIPNKALSCARELSKKLAMDKSLLKNLQKDKSFNDAANRSYARKIMEEMAENGEWTLDAYDALFPTTQRHPIAVSKRGWDILRLYLCKLDDKDEEDLEVIPYMRSVHPKIEQASKLYFDTYVQNNGLEKFKRNVLDRLARGKLSVPWLRERFFLLAEEYEGFDYGTWDEFVCDENGKPQAFELLFQMRLQLANLYREYKSNHTEEAQ